MVDGFSVEALRNGAGNASVSGFSARSERLGGVLCERIIVDAAPPALTIMYAHGGGYLRGKPDEFRGASVEVAHATHAEVVAPEYRLAPENPFPSAVEDCLAVYTALVADTATKGTRLVLFGDSAGAALVVAVMLAARDSGIALPESAVLHCPYADMTGSSPSVSDPNYLNERLSTARINWLRETYLAAGNPDPRDPRHSPVYADLTGLPPMLIQIGGRDPFHDDGVRLALRAEESGVDVTLTEYKGSEHVWVVKGTNPKDPEAGRAVGEIARFVAAHAGALR